jgi:hypothetical protein
MVSEPSVFTRTLYIATADMDFSRRDSIIWSIRICLSLTRWDLKPVFHVNLSWEYGLFGKLNRLNRFRVCDWRCNYFPILCLKIRSERFGWSMIREWSSISLEWENRCSRNYTQTSGIV